MRIKEKIIANANTGVNGLCKDSICVFLCVLKSLEVSSFFVISNNCIS